MTETYDGIYYQVKISYSNRFGNSVEIIWSMSDHVKTLAADEVPGVISRLKAGENVDTVVNDLGYS